MKDSQNKRLLKHLESGESINPLQAWNELGIYRLSARIFDLRDLNEITTTIIQVENKFGETFNLAEYRLKV